MTIDRFWELLSKKHCGEVSSAEIKEFEDILLAHPEWKNTADTLSNLNFQSTVLGDSNEVELAFETHLNRMKRADIGFTDVELNGDETGVPKRTRNFKKWLIPVAVVAAGPDPFFCIRKYDRFFAKEE